MIWTIYIRLQTREYYKSSKKQYILDITIFLD